jgi:hypothetical protein
MYQDTLHLVTPKPERGQTDKWTWAEIFKPFMIFRWTSAALSSR